jgi:hypothetical protein
MSSEKSNFEDVPQAKINDLSGLAFEARELTDKIERHSKLLGEYQERLRIILEGEMPEIMMEIGMEQLKLTTGEKLTMTKYYAANIKEENRAAAFKWLRENNFDSLIKNEVKGKFGKGEDEVVKRIMATLNTIVPGVFESKESVHPMTLKSFVKEQIEAGKEVPTDTFSVFIGNKIKIG